MTKKCLWLMAILWLFKLSPAVAQAQQFDVFIKNAVVFKGDGKDSVRTNIGISAQRISYIGSKVFAAKEVIDAKGKYLAPGFIDPHTHASRLIDDKKDPFLLPWLTQGVTTVFMGSDGGGTFKVDKQIKAFQKIGVGTNYSFFVGFGPIRTEVLGQMNVKPSAEQLAAMKVLVNKGMEEGGIGFSTGLIYLPQMYAKTDEIKALFQETAKYNAVYDTHMRAEGADVLKSVDEVLAIGRRIE